MTRDDLLEVSESYPASGVLPSPLLVCGALVRRALLEQDRLPRRGGLVAGNILWGSQK